LIVIREGISGPVLKGAGIESPHGPVESKQIALRFFGDPMVCRALPAQFFSSVMK
jgi:hypothetical protein